MHALGDARWAPAWRQWATRLPRPQAILVISAHWETHGIRVTAMDQPRTLHDFRGFPPELFAVSYPAPGSPALARRVLALLDADDRGLDSDWGLDHGAWAVLRHLFPGADVPVVQLSLDLDATLPEHLARGRALAGLREEGVLLLGSGNLVHNLARMDWRPGAPPADWALRAEADIRTAIASGDLARLCDPYQHITEARLAIPTREHWLPLLPVLGSRAEGESVSFPVEGIDAGSISMLAVQVGA